MKERRGCPNCAKALALINQHLSGRVYDDLDDALRNLLQAFVTMRDLEIKDSKTKPGGNSKLPHCELCAVDGEERPASFILEGSALCFMHWKALDRMRPQQR